jgi:hypothetical protein
MYEKFLLTSILFTIALIPNVPQSAHALGCVNVDISNQLDIAGKNAQTKQRNNVNQEIDQNCIGNTSVHKTTQVNVSPDGANQTRNSNQYLGGSGNSAIPDSVMGAGNVNFHTGTQTSIHTPALNQNFLHK